MGFSTRLRALMKQEVPAADVEAMLRGTGQIEDLRQRIEEKRLEGELRFPGRPWESYAELGSALVYFWIAEAMVAIARNLHETAVGGAGGKPGFMPRVSHEQAMALLRQAADHLARANAALTGPSAEEAPARPVPLRPRVESRGRCPAPHLKGMLRAAQYLDRQAQVDVQTYCNAVAKEQAPVSIDTASQRLQAELAKAQFSLNMAEQAVMPILNGESVDDATHEDAESKLWSSLQAYTWLGQVVAIPALLDTRRPERAEPGDYSGGGYRGEASHERDFRNTHAHEHGHHGYDHADEGHHGHEHYHHGHHDDHDEDHHYSHREHDHYRSHHHHEHHD